MVFMFLMFLLLLIVFMIFYSWCVCIGCHVCDGHVLSHHVPNVFVPKCHVYDVLAIGASAMAIMFLIFSLLVL